MTTLPYFTNAMFLFSAVGLKALIILFLSVSYYFYEPSTEGIEREKDIHDVHSLDDVTLVGFFLELAFCAY